MPNSTHLKLPKGDQQEIWSWTSYITHFLGAISILLGMLSPVICPRKQIMSWLLIGISFVIAAYLVDYEGYRKWQHQLIYSPIYITLICLVFRKIGIRIISIAEWKQLSQKPVPPTESAVHQ